MKVLSLREPGATLIKEKKKLVETRSWKTDYRGELYIHGSSASFFKLLKNDERICRKNEKDQLSRVYLWGI